MPAPFVAHIRPSQGEPLRVVVVMADTNDEAEQLARQELALGEWLESCYRADFTP